MAGLTREALELADLQRAHRLATRSALPHVLGGLLGSQIENNMPGSPLHDASPEVKNINTALGGATGFLGARFGWPKALAGVTVKQLGLMGTSLGKKYIDTQQPIADTNLQTAKLQQGTAQLMADQSKSWKPTDLAQLGLAGAGLAGAGGLGYYLYKTLGPGKKKPTPKVTVNLPMSQNHGNVAIESDMDSLTLSKHLQRAIKRDQRRQLLESARDNTHHVNHSPETKHAFVFELPATPALDRVLSLLEIV